jgi:hypothetical protein
MENLMDTGEENKMYLCHTLREFTALICENMSQTEKLKMQKNILTAKN